MDIGKTIGRVRKQMGLSQAKLASAVGITQTSLSQIENGVTRPNQKTLNAICKEIGIPESLLYVLSIKREDVPDNRKEIYDTLYPSIKDFMIKIFHEGDEGQSLSERSS